MSDAKIKKELILEIFEDAPALSNAMIAKLANASEGYVRRLVNPLRNSMSNQATLRQKELNALRKAQRVEKINWNRQKISQYYFIKTYLPQKEYKYESQQTKDFLRTDFIDYLLPTEDAWSSSGSGQDFSGSWSQFEYLSERRIGLGPKITRFPAEDAVREGFKFINKKTQEVVPLTNVYSRYDKKLSVEKWLKDTDFKNSFAKAIYMERVFGISFLIPYFSENDKEKGVLSKAYKESEGYPKAFESIAQTVAAPLDYYESTKLDKDPQKWSIRGGYYDPQEIHYSRVRVLMSRPVIGRWYGLSIWEPIWDSGIPYYQALIFLLRGFSKWGNMIVKYLIDQEGDLSELYDDHVDLVEEMKMNMTFIGPRSTDIGFENTQLATGLRDMMEIWIEDISAGTGIPVNILMGRVVSSGLSGVGNLVAERYYWNTIKKIQQAFTDDVQWCLELAGFDLTDLEIDWNLAITKTDQQRLIDEGLQIENEIMKERLIQERVMTDRVISGEAFEDEQQEGGNGDANKPKQQKTDFILETIKKRRAELLKGRGLN